MKNTIIAFVLGVVVCAAIGMYFFSSSITVNVDQTKDVDDTKAAVEVPTTTTPTNSATNTEKVTAAPTTPMLGKHTLGKSAGGNDVDAYHFGTGDTELLFIGGIHGAYGPNTALVAYELVKYLEEDPKRVPEDMRVTVIPLLNPDGTEKVFDKDGRFTLADVTASLKESIPGRFNANNVDLNRNFDCDWQSEGVWQNTKVSGGAKAFSEPESQIVRDYVETHTPAAVVAWYSAAGGVYASTCHNGILPDTTKIMNTYAKASGYPAYDSFDFYEVTGDMVNWLAGEGVPAISVLMTDHTNVEWEKNKKGILALFEQYAQ